MDRKSTPWIVAALALAVGACASACSGDAPAPPVAPQTGADPYPTLAALYSADQGLYAGCGPNNNVCHNSKQFPDLSSLGSIVDHVGDRCNELVDRPEKMHDLCERPGDLLVVGDESIEISWVEAVEGDLARFRIVLAIPPAGMAGGDYAAIERVDGDERVLVGELYDVTLETDAGDPKGLLVTLPAPQPELEDEDPSLYLTALLANAGVPADPGSIQLGDPNRNGTFGARLEGRLIKPGDPGKSFILRRLTDPAAGPLMPLANCCHWSKDAVRAMWCWIAGLEADGSNALTPIDYASCPPGPAVDHLAYPAPGEGCEGSGMCPVQSTLPASDEPTWENVYGNVMTRRCAGAGCHFDGGGSGLKLADEEIAYTSLVGGGLVVPGDPDASVLHERVSKACAPTESCDRMPLGLDPLPDAEIEAIRGWIEAGAPR